MISKDTRNATSSQASQGGASPCASPDGPMTGKSGPVLARASLSQLRANKEEPTTNATSGPLFNASSPSRNLQRSLESKLRLRMAGLGSPLYALTWKHWGMLAGPRICALRASGHRTSDNGCGGWQTPHAPRSHDSDQSRSTYLDRQLIGDGELSILRKGVHSDKYLLNPAFSLWLMGYPGTWFEHCPSRHAK